MKSTIASGATAVSDGNSSTSALDNGNTFTGDWEYVADHDSLVVAVKTDQDGQFTVEFSPDGTNADSVLTRYYRTSQIEAPHRFTIARAWARVTFTNDSGSNQTYFRLQTLLGDKSELNAPCDSTLAQDFDATVVRPTDYHYEVALGRRQGAQTWNKFGYNDDVDSGTEVLAAFGGTFTPLTSAVALDISSSSANDDGNPAGTGARTLRIFGVDANRMSVTEDITLNGTTTVTTSGTWLGVNRVAVTSSGSGLGNAGDITIQVTGGGATQAYLPAGEAVTQQLIFFMDADAQGMADWLRLNALKDGPSQPAVVTFKGWIFNPLTNTKFEVFRETMDTEVENHFELKPSQPFVFSAGDVFWIEATTDQNNTNVSGRLSLIVVNDVDA